MKTVLFYLFAVTTLTTLAQQTDSTFKKNAIKFDAGKLVFDEVGISYERWFTNKLSASISFANNPVFGERYGSSRGSNASYYSPYYNKFVGDTVSEKTTYSYWYVSPKVKYYLGKKAPKGFYAGASLFFVTNKEKISRYSKVVDAITKSTIAEEQTNSEKKHFNTHAGLSLGYNLILFKRLNIDPSLEILTTPLGGINSTQQNSNFYANIAIGYLF